MHLRLVRIRQKHFKRSLVINRTRGRVLQNFLIDIIKDEVLVVNTNFGLDVYYISKADCTDIVVSAFNILANEELNEPTKFPISSYNSIDEIREVVLLSLMQLSSTRHTFVNYSKSFLNQINENLKVSRKIVKILLQICDDSLKVLSEKDRYKSRLELFKKDFESLFAKDSLDPVVTELIKKAFAPDRLN